jgi:hypothetical protein
MASWLLQREIATDSGMCLLAAISLLEPFNYNTMSKTVSTFLVAVVCLLMAGTASAQLARWALTSDGSPTIMTPGITPGDFTRGNGISSLSYSSEGVTATGWPATAQKGVVDYYEVCITPVAGNTFQVTGLTFDEKRDADGVKGYQIFSSIDGFRTSERIDSSATPAADVQATRTINNLDQYLCDGRTICFRWYGYDAGSPAGNWILKNIKIEGIAFAACTAPTIQTGGISFTSILDNSVTIQMVAGTGDRRLVLARAGEPIDIGPCSGESYNANATFGQGDEVSAGTYVVYNGSGLSFTMDGLTPGQTYHLSVREYNSSGFCYLNTDPITDVIAANCSNPVASPSIIANPGNNEAHIMWEMPSCYDAVMLLASTAPIDGFPTGFGDAYDPDANFGDGTMTDGGFTGSVFPVYAGIDNRVTVTGLINGTTYYFELYTRVRDTWAGPMMVELTPMEVCTDIGEDILYLNEVHYLNNGIDQDEGVEVLGPAGVDLKAYSLVLYEYDANVFYHVEDLSGVIDDEGDGKGAVWFPIPDMWDMRGGIALYNKAREEVVQFLSYRGVFTALDGVAAGMESDLMMNAISGVAESNATPVNSSLQLVGTGSCPEDMLWEIVLDASRGTINDMQSILPIELGDFKATLVDEEVLISWQTISEINNDYMAVERSGDGQSFKEIGRVQGAGTTNIPQNYQLWDLEPDRGTNYYRLRQVDFDGAVSYSPVVVVTLDAKETGFTVFPTVTGDRATVSLTGNTDTEAQILIINTLGEVVERHLLAPGEQSVLLDAQAWAPGHYFVQLIVRNETFTERLIRR